MAHAFIAAAVRTPVGRNRGGLSGVHPADLGAHVLRAVIDRTGIDPAAVDDVIFGCVDQVGAQSLNIARTAWLSAGLPESVPGTTIDRQCGSAQQAIHFAAHAVQAGAQDLVIAGGVEVMSRVPIAAGLTAGEAAGYGHALTGEGWLARYGDQEISQFRGAELIAERWGITRFAMEEFALASHQRASAAIERGDFDDEIAPYGDVMRDEGPRPTSTMDKLASLKPIREGGRLTAALASQISDGAAAVLIASENAVREHGLTPLARIHSTAIVGSDPVLMLTGPILATQRILARANVRLDEIELIEINEAFASVVLAWQKETGADPEQTNALGGAIALGHPLGATGARLMTTLVHHMRRTGARYGLQTMCEGGGMANATIVERT
jgi:acetyl-CoA C-acetyltransferase